MTLNMILQRFRKRFYLYLSQLLSQKQYWNTVGKMFPLDAVLDNCFDPKLFFKSGKETVLFFEKEKIIKKSYKTLQIGCGVGRIEKELSLKAKQVYGVDISEVMIAQAKKNVKRKNAHFFATNGESLPFEKNHFDFIYSLLVFQHMSKHMFVKNLKEVQRVLKPNGKFLFQIPVDEKGVMKKPESKNPWLMRYYTRKEIEQMLKKINFKIIKTYSEFGKDRDKDLEPDYKVLAVKS